jgi:hypothetical protein
MGLTGTAMSLVRGAVEWWHGGRGAGERQRRKYSFIAKLDAAFAT